MGNRNSSSSKVHGQVTRVASTDTSVGMPVAKFRDEYMRKPKAEKRGGVYSDNTPLDNDETFTSFIRHAKYKIKTVSHIDGEQISSSSVATASPPDEEANGRDNQNDQFSNFIVSAKKKLRSSSSMRRNSSFKIA